MLKKLPFLLLLLICSMSMNLANAEIIYVYDENDGLITNATDGDEGCQVSCDFKAGEFGSSAEGSYANLIDNNLGTFFTSAWDGSAPEPDDHPHYLQIDLKDRPQQKIIFYMGIRDDQWGQTNRPTKLTITASNDVESWKEIITLEMPNAANVKEMYSDMIDLGESYRYLRFNVLNSNGGGYIGNYPYFAIGEFQVYEALSKEISDALAQLKKLYNTLSQKAAFPTGGTDVGYYDEGKIMAYEDQMIKTGDLLENGGSDDAYAAQAEALQNAYDAVLSSGIALVDGYYYFISGFPEFKNQQGVEKAMFVNENNMLCWQNFDPNNAMQLFKIAKQEDGTYTIQNVASGTYIGAVEGTSAHLPMTETPTVGQTIKNFDGTAQWKIANALNDQAYHSAEHNSGVGVNGRVVTWDGNANSCSAWIIRPITDQSLIDKLVNEGSKQYIAYQMKIAINNAQETRKIANDLEALITKASQISSNAQSSGDGSAYGNLIDGNTGSIFHSIWNDSYAAPQEEGSGQGWHNLQFALDTEVSKIIFTYIGRDNGDGWHDNPNHIQILATNDDNLGQSTSNADSTLWTEIVDMTKEAYGLPGNGNMVSYSSPMIDLGTSYKYLRFVVKHVSTQDGGNRANSFASPKETGVTFNLSEFQIYDAIPTAKSEYYTVDGMKEACDELDKLINEGLAKIGSLTATEADIEALNAAAKKIKELYVDRDALDKEMAALLKEGKDVYNTATGGRITLVTDAAQFSTNSNEPGEGSLANMLDGDLNTKFHSAWNEGGMKNANITEEEWAEILSTTSFPGTGVGYHNLQIKLNEPVSEFYFTYSGRYNSPEWSDAPNYIKILATNDDELGASTDNADEDGWNEIITIADKAYYQETHNMTLPENVVDQTFSPRGSNPSVYTSPVISLKDSYKYIRFVILGTNNARLAENETGSENRLFLNPDVTGISWNLSEFQMYTGLSADRTQINYIEGMKEACDALKTLLDQAEAMEPHTMVTTEFNDNLRAAFEKVMSLYADSTEMVKLYNEYIENINNSEVNEGIGYVDSQESIDEFANAIQTAKKSVSPTSPTVEQLNTAIADMNSAFKTFMTHVGQIEPNRWYTIVAGSLREYAKDQPIFLISTSIGTEIALGGYPVETTDPATDPYSVWRFVPIEGAEGQYAIQNLGTGQYIGAYTENNRMLTDHAKVPYELFYFGKGKFKIHQVGVEDKMDCFKADQSNQRLFHYPLNNDEQATWYFKEADEDLSINWYPNKSTKIMTLPFAISEDLPLSELNAGMTTYAVKALYTTEEGTRLELVEKNGFEAGEPFVVVADNGTDDANFPILLAQPETVVDTSAVAANGLIGTLQGMTITTPGMGIFTKSEEEGWKLTRTTGSVFISGRDGYLDPKQVTNITEGEADLIITTGDMIDGVKEVTIVKNGERVNVYTIDGQLIKRNVKAADASKSLQKGIYIIGKKKVAVK